MDDLDSLSSGLPASRGVEQAKDTDRSDQQQIIKCGVEELVVIDFDHLPDGTNLEANTKPFYDLEIVGTRAKDDGNLARLMNASSACPTNTYDLTICDVEGNTLIVYDGDLNDKAHLHLGDDNERYLDSFFDRDISKVVSISILGVEKEESIILFDADGLGIDSRLLSTQHAGSIMETFEIAYASISFGIRRLRVEGAGAVAKIEFCTLKQHLGDASVSALDSELESAAILSSATTSSASH